MKRLLIFLILAAGFVSSCKKEDELAAKPETRLTFDVAAFDIEGSKFPKIGPSVSAVGDTVSNYLNFIDCFVFDSTETFITKYVQAKTDPQFGRLSFDLPAGNYTIAFVGRYGNGFADFTHAMPKVYQNLEFKRLDRLDDMFSKTIKVKVVGSPINQSVRLERNIGALEVNIEDQIPANTTSMTLTIVDEAVRFVSTGAISGFTYFYQTDVPLTTADKGQLNRKFFMHVANTEKPFTLRIDFNVAGTNYRKLINNVRCYNNQVTKLTGKMFQ